MTTGLIIYLIGVVIAYFIVGYLNDRENVKGSILWIFTSYLMIVILFTTLANDDIFDKLSPTLKPFKKLFNKIFNKN